MCLKLKESLENKERCVVVSGSKKYAIELVNAVIQEGLIKGELDEDGIYIGDEVKLYHSGNPLDLTCKVNEEWSKCKLLIYSPTITCGVSYDNPKALFDRLFVYMPNKFSACFRDATQALKRVRQFTKDEIYLCLNLSGNYNRDMSPVYFDKVKELIYTYKPQIFTDEKHYISLQTTEQSEYKPLKNWVSEARIYNILEANISGIYLEDVAKTYLEIENIHYTFAFIDNKYEMPEYESKESYTWEEVQELDYNMMEINEKKERNERLTGEEYWFMIADDYSKSLKEDVSEFHKALYWDNYIKDTINRYQYYSTIKFNRIVQQKSIDELFEKTDSKKILEINSFYDERYSHLYKMFKQMEIITEDHKINYEKEFMKEDLEPLLKDYEALRMKGGLKAFNQLLKNEKIREWSEQSESEMDIDKMYIMVKHLAKDLLGLEAGRIKQKKKRVLVDGVKKQVFLGVFRFAPKKYIEYEMVDKKKKIKSSIELPVSLVAHENFLEVETDLKPADWFNDSGITSEEDGEGW